MPPTGVDPTCRADRIPKLEDSKNGMELPRIDYMYIIDVRASHYKINPPLLITVRAIYTDAITQKHSLAPLSTLSYTSPGFTSSVMCIIWVVMCVNY